MNLLVLTNVFCILVTSVWGTRLDGFEVEPRIIGGAVHEKRYPFIVSLHADSIYGRVHICGGSIINQRTILTAAHCVLNVTPTILKVHVGDKSLKVKEGEVYDVESIYSHEKYNKTKFDYDVALIRIKGLFNFGPTVLPIKLATSRDKIKDGSYALVLGWGFTDLDNKTLADDLMAANVPIVKQATCKRQMDVLITKRMICAGYKTGGIDACTYDSGGPLVLNDKQIGIVSFGDGCAQPNKPGVYSRISVLLPWIKNILLKQYHEILY